MRVSTGAHAPGPQPLAIAVGKPRISQPSRRWSTIIWGVKGVSETSLMIMKIPKNVFLGNAGIIYR